MNKTSFFFFIFIFLSGCAQQKKAPRPAVLSLQQLGMLATAEYRITRIVKASDNEAWYKWGDRKILLSCNASVKAGIDFTSLKSQQVVQKGESVYVQLPPPQIISLNIPPEGIKVAFADVGVFRDPFSSSEINAIMKTAEGQIQRQIRDLPILATARSNASTFVTRFLSNAGFGEIYVSFQ